MFDGEATSQSSEAPATDTAKIESLLGGAETTTEEAAPATEETEEQTGTGETEGAETEGDEATGDESTEEGDESQEAAGEEDDDLSLGDKDRDYSQEAYERAAKVFSKNLKHPYNPDDPKDRATLRELISRGEALKASKAAEAAAAAKATEEGTEAETKETEVADARAKTPQQIQENIKQVQEFAKTRVVPEIAKHIANRFVKALWPNAEPLSNAQELEIGTVLTEMGVFLFQDMAPLMADRTLSQLGSDPVYSRVTTMATREAAFEMLDSQKDSGGNPLYPDLERMVNRGALQAVIKKYDWLAKADFGERDPIKREMKRYDAAYQLARGVDPATVGQAVQTGEKRAKAAARQVAAARTAPGKTRGELESGASPRDAFVKELTTSSEGRFSRAVEAGRKNNS